MADYGYATHVVHSGDSLQKIAVQYGIEDWREIAYFNKLNYPFIADGDLEFDGNVAKVGSVIYIPSYNYAIPPSSEDLDFESMCNQVYGCDLDVYTALDDNGKAQNLEYKGELSGKANDVRLVKGIENLKQQLNIKLSTRKGSLMLHPDWGCNILNMIGTKGSEENLTDMMLMVKEAILEDFRVKSITELSITKDTRKVVISCSIHPISPYSDFPYTTVLIAD